MTNNYRVSHDPVQTFLESLSDFKLGRDFCLVFRTDNTAMGEFGRACVEMQSDPDYEFVGVNLIIRDKTTKAEARFITEGMIDRLRGLVRTTIVVAAADVYVPNELQERFR